jgi:cytosine deaminase
MISDMPTQPHYWLINARVPICLLKNIANIKNSGESSDRHNHNQIQPDDFVTTSEDLAAVDLEINNGKITAIRPTATNQLNQAQAQQTQHDRSSSWFEQLVNAAQAGISDISTTSTTAHKTIPAIDLRQGMILPCFIDMHTHLDKGHIWNRHPNLRHDFDGAIAASKRDIPNWSLSDLEQRMEFGIKCSYAHGTSAIRTHLDCLEPNMAMSLKAFTNLRDRWVGKVELQAVSLTMPEQYMGESGEQIARAIMAVNGSLGAVFRSHPDPNPYIDRLFSLAQKYNLDLDLHIDETDDPNSDCLHRVAIAALRHNFQGKIICGHCCSLAVQEPEQIINTIALIKQANIGIVSLPTCNLYLQNRHSRITPWWRGVTLLHELKAAHVPVALASDNCRDPFLSLGDHDCLEVFKLGSLIAHLDMPYGDWISTITKTAADLIDLPQMGRLGVGLDADLVLFTARNYSELLSRPQNDRQIIRNGKVITPQLPSYSELDHLVSP